MKPLMQASVVLVTPQIAEWLLKFNHGNRPLNRGNIVYWKSVLTGRSVTLGHQGIALVGDMQNPVRLLDGQHRLMAIIETGIPQEFLVVTGVPEESFANLDNGMPRSLANRADVAIREAQMATSFYYFAKTTRAKVPVALVRDIVEIVRPYMELVTDSKKKHLSLTSIRCAFVIQQRKFGFNHSTQFQTGQFSEMPESLNALYRRQMSSPLGIGGGMGQLAAFCATWNCIEKPSISRVSTQNSTAMDARRIVTENFPEIITAISRFQVAAA